MALALEYEGKVTSGTWEWGACCPAGRLHNLLQHWPAGLALPRRSCQASYRMRRILVVLTRGVRAWFWGIEVVALDWV